mmetsp:Transcript_20980/g.34198  ORF Transcript_20980/g.34198 Transcript_20980/m.34198 type:complete len:425 (+) Transcript_20980:110-1384(+)
MNCVVLSSIWPEVSSSAAGVRTFQLLQLLRRSDKIKRVVFVTTSARKEIHAGELERVGVECRTCQSNRAEGIETILGDVKPDLAVFDRFLSEELFSFHIHKHFPDCLRVLDSQDLHSLRESRRHVIKKQNGSVIDAVRRVPKFDEPLLLRELSAIHRCDLTLLVSDAEEKLLMDHYGIMKSKLALCPLLFDDKQRKEVPPFGGRQHFVSIGTFRHAPNCDSVEWLSSEVWPRIRERLPNAEIHIYGSYLKHNFQSMSNKKTGFLVKGFMDNLDSLQNYRVCLAPLRFGAGIKGKIIDAWRYGVPVVTTPIGSEGMTLHSGGREWGGEYECYNPEDLVEASCRLYEKPVQWESCQQTGYNILETRFNQQESTLHVMDTLLEKLSTFQADRATDPTMNLLWWQGNRASEYFSRWIELKETKSTKDS